MDSSGQKDGSANTLLSSAPSVISLDAFLQLRLQLRLPRTTEAVNVELEAARSKQKGSCEGAELHGKVPRGYPASQQASSSQLSCSTGGLG